ncbi:MAG: CRISPR-associated helicase Cas3' [Symbiobacteriia bacterium]
MPSPVLHVWAKSDPMHPLMCHMIDVGNVAVELLRQGPFAATVRRFAAATGILEDQVPAWMAYLAALHDLGKCRAAFQNRQPGLALPLEEAGISCATSDVDKGYRHEAVSASWLRDYLVDTQGWPVRSAGTVAAAIAGHHGRFDVDEPSAEPPARREQWEPLRLELEALIRRTFQPSDWRGQFQHQSVAGLLLSGLVVLADWIASNAELFGLRWEGETLADYVQASRERAERAVHRLGLDGQQPWTSPMTFREVWPEIADPHPLQEKCESLVRRGLAPGLVIIEAPMGGGKTEAALYLATQWLGKAAAEGIFVALPTSATSNQMFSRFKRLIERHDPGAVRGVRLVHGTSWLLDEATPSVAPELFEGKEQALDWFRPRKRSLLATYGVGTVDQALMSVLHVKHGFLRLFGLAGKVLVVDEVHAYDAYMAQILDLLLQWCSALGVPVILLSATLPQGRRRALVQAYDSAALLNESQEAGFAPYPLITWVEPGGKVTEEPVELATDTDSGTATGSAAGGAKVMNVELRHHHGLLADPAGVAKLVAERVANGGCHCVITNTVDSAQNIYRALKALVPEDGPAGVQLLLFHGRFPVAERQRIEAEALALFDKRSLLPEGDPERKPRPERAVLVATQVVEQSLDLDFDEMYTELAPVDLLLQRAGRLHRHPRQNRPTGGTPTLHLLLPPEDRVEFGPSGNVYSPYILFRTLALTATQDVWRLPVEIRQYVEAVYRDVPPPPGVSVEEAWLTTARAKWFSETEEKAEAANLFLIRTPAPRRFRLGQDPKAVFDEESREASSYFNAKTRYEDDSVNVLLAEGDGWADTLLERHSPPLAVLKELHLNTVRLSRWWLQGVEPEAGYSGPESAPAWMPGTTVLRLSQGCWRGRMQDGRAVEVRVEPEYGVIRSVAP